MKNIIPKIFIFICSITLIISGYNIVKWKIDSNKSKKVVNEIDNATKIKEIKDSAKTEIIKSNEDKSNPYWDYIKMNLIDVDFNYLKKKNSNTKGWINVSGTNINYPFVQTNDNKYYLDHDFNNSYNSAGWVFADYRNKLDGTDKNTILYAHGRLDGRMFGTLRNILKSDWFNNSSNYVVRISTEHENTLWQVFSIYKIPTTNDYIRTQFNNDFKEFASTLIKRSNYDFKTNVNENDKILTLSTCYDSKEKVVLHAKLIKKEVK